MSVPVRIELLGGFRLTVAGRTVTSLPRKAEALLAYLAMQDGRPVTRESAADLLWTDRGAEQARNSLRETLRVLRRDVAEVIPRGQSPLTFVPGMVETDIGRFRLLSRSSDRGDLAEAAELYRGELLAGYSGIARDFDDWLRDAREILSKQAIEAMGRLSDMCLAAGDSHSAVLAAERMLALDLLREDSHRKMMEIYLRAGRRTDAIRQYETCVEVLKRELDVGPSEETVALGAALNVPDTRGITSRPRMEFVAASPNEGPPRVAVLPFRSIGPDPMPSYFSSGLTEDVVTILAAVREPVVVCAHMMAPHAVETRDIRAIGRDLGVAYVVVGSVQQADARMRISARLTDARDGTLLWSDAYNAEALMLFDAQETIARRIAYSVVPNIHDSEMRRLRNKKPESMTAYDFLLQARDAMLSLSPKSFDRAGDFLSKATTTDAGFAAAHALTADWYAVRVGQGWSHDPNDDARQSDQSARTAIALDGFNAQALALHANTRSFLYRDYSGAVRIFDRIAETTPNDASTWMWSAGTYAYMDNGAEAVRRAEHAIKLSPRDRFAFRFYTALSLAYYTIGDYDRAVDWGMQAIREAPAYTSSLRFTIASLVAAGRITDAKALSVDLMRVQPNFRVRTVRERHPYRDQSRRNKIADQLILADLPE